MKASLSFQWFLCSLALILGQFRPAFAEDNPNILLIVVENLGAHDLSCHGSKFHRTPHLDRLTKDGLQFTQAYSPATSETPSQAALLTGKSPARLQITGNTFKNSPPVHRPLSPVPSRSCLPPAEITCAELLKTKEYKTAFLGNWRLGDGDSSPDHQGFDVVSHTTADPSSLFTAAENFINQNHARPFFLCMSVDPGQISLEKSQDLVTQSSHQNPPGLQRNPEYAARLEIIDRYVGNLLQKLNDLKISQKTLLAVTSTNGGIATGDENHPPYTNNAPLREGKGFLYEGGIRVPLILGGTKLVKPGTTCDQPVSSQDLLSTFAEICGVQVPSEIDGVSLVPYLKGETQAHPPLFWHMPVYSPEGGRPAAAIRDGDFKLLEFFETGRRELFKVGKEPGEGTNLTDKEPERAARMADQLAAWHEKVNASIPQPDPACEPLEQSGDGSLTLPASEADVHGVMLRYEPLPHKNTLGFWVRPDDWASWTFRIAKPGRFQLRILQGCGTKSGGSRVEFRVGDESVTTTVEETGGFQQFKSRQIGTINIASPGNHTLTVKALSKPGVAVMDLREVRLIPVP